MSLLMGLIRRLPVFFRAQQNKEYVRRPTDDVFGKTVGSLGLAAMGNESQVSWDLWLGKSSQLTASQMPARV